jgi:hypothetical protein
MPAAVATASPSASQQHRGMVFRGLHCTRLYSSRPGAVRSGGTTDARRCGPTTGPPGPLTTAGQSRACPCARAAEAESNAGWPAVATLLTARIAVSLCWLWSPHRPLPLDRSAAVASAELASCSCSDPHPTARSIIVHVTATAARHRASTYVRALCAHRDRAGTSIGPCQGTVPKHLI